MIFGLQNKVDFIWRKVKVRLLFTDLKNEPYRRADGVRRSQRKRVEMELTGDGDREYTIKNSFHGDIYLQNQYDFLTCYA